MEGEVERLRLLRAKALRVRAVAQAMAEAPAWTSPLLVDAQCAAWRIARTISGRLRGHPYERNRRDASLGVLLVNQLVAAWALVVTRHRRGALQATEKQLQQLARELDDCRAVTRSADLSESFSRSRQELRSLIGKFPQQSHAASQPRPVDSRPARDVGATPADSPYLAL